MNVKRVSVGTGFALPPDVTPLPVFAPWLEAPKDRLDAAERQVLGAINAALLHHRRQPLGKLSELVNTGCDTLCTYPELDHYASRGGSPNYVGPIYDTPLNRPPSWPERGGPRIFAYLAAQSAHLAQTIAALSAVNAGTLLVIQGPVDPETIAARGPNLQISSLPVNLNLALPQAQLVICHANLGLVSQALKAGVPMVLLPRNPEQIGTAIRVAAMGAGLMLRGPVTDTRIKAAIAQALDDRVMAARTKEVAVKFAAHESKIAAESAAGVILERAKNQNPI